jgi:hypothetical protein
MNQTFGPDRTDPSNAIFMPREARPAEGLQTTAFTIASPRPAPATRVDGSHQRRLVPACPIAEEARLLGPARHVLLALGRTQATRVEGSHK